jgi:hypothetical protein
MNRRFFLQLSAASSLAGWRFAGAAPRRDPAGGHDRRFRERDPYISGA